jgi:hypothetical protein
MSLFSFTDPDKCCDPVTPPVTRLAAPTIGGRIYHAQRSFLAPRPRSRYGVERRRHELPLQLSPDPVDHPGADRFGLIARKLDRDCAEEGIAHCWIERLREVHEYVEFGVGKCESAAWDAFLVSARRTRLRTRCISMCWIQPRPRTLLALGAGPSFLKRDFCNAISARRFTSQHQLGRALAGEVRGWSICSPDHHRRARAGGR